MTLGRPDIAGMNPPGHLQYISRLAKTQRYIVQQCLSGAAQPWCYHTQFSYHLQITNLVAPLFFKALQSVVRRHPIMRTVFFDRGDGQIWQGIDPALELAVQFYDINRQAAGQHDEWIRRFLLADRDRPFDLLNGEAALVRAFMIKRSTETLQLVLVFHHAIWDGWSLAVLVKEIFDVYQTLRTSPTLSLHPAAYDYQDFISDELSERHSAEAMRFWAEHLRDHHEYRIERQFSDADLEAYEPVHCMLDADLVARLEQCARRQRVTMKSLFVALFVYMIHDESQQSHATIGMVSNGRSIRLKSPLTTLGLLWNLAPLCVETDPLANNLTDHIRSVHHALADTAAFCDYPLVDILKDRGVDQLFHAAFNYIDFGSANIVRKDSGIRFLDSGGLDKFHFPLHLLVGRNPFDRNISLVLNFDSRCYSAQQIRSKLGRYLERLQQWCGENCA